jgi:hypothetical protein
MNVALQADSLSPKHILKIVFNFSGPREQAVLHPRQEDGQGLRHREDALLLHVQVPFCSPFLNILFFSLCLLNI